ncbi:MAG: hypothetical protein JWN58_760, partial [Gammaproteobacteria bacterium]|nr:hypothetical protein [Gammaproteobacteria bacterium]
CAGLPLSRADGCGAVLCALALNANLFTDELVTLIPESFDELIGAKNQ